MKHELSVKDVAHLTGLSEAMISRVERRERVLAPLTKAKVAHRLGADIGELFEVEEIPEAELVTASV